MKAATQKQNNMLYKFTLLKFWEVQSPPPPTIEQASNMITNMINWAHAVREKSELAEEYKKVIIALVREFFPDWDGESLKNRFFGKRKRYTPESGNFQEDTENSIPEPEQPEEKQEENKPEPKQEKKQEPKQNRKHADPTIDNLLKNIEAGIRNFYLVGPAGTGKTTICKEVAKMLDVPCTILSCNSGTSSAEITGFKYPEPRPSVVSQAIGVKGIVVFDEITMLDASVAAAANALLANDEIYTSTGLVVRDPDCIIIATANTIGDGANRTYVGNNQLDASTLDRFIGGFITVDYNKKYELENFDNEVVYYVHALRQIIANNGFRRIASTRTIIACDKLKKAGLPWKYAATAQWSDEEKQAIRS